jgi:hypothetical protein
MPDLIPSRSIVKRPSRWWPWLRAGAFGIQLMLAAYFVLSAVNAYVVRTRLQAVLADMDRTDPGWRLPDIEAARAVVPDAENSALRVIAANKLLPQPPQQWIEDDFDVELYNLSPERRMAPAQYAHLRQCLDKVKPALDELEGLSELPNGRFPIVYAQNPWGTLVPEQQKARCVIHLLMRDCMAHAEVGEAHQAVNSCLGAFNAGRSIGDEPFAITQLIRFAGVIIACQTADRILAQTEPESDDLKRLQGLIELEDKTPYRQITWRGERAIANAFLEPIETGATTFSEMGGEKPDWAESVFPFAFQDYVRSIHPQLFLYSARMQAAAKLPPQFRQPALQQIMQEIGDAKPNPVTLLFFNYPKIEITFCRTNAMLRCHVAGLAAERYRRLHGDWPQSLVNLTPHLLAAVPTDPFADDPLLYRRVPDGVVIYSVGLDGEDNGGNVDAGKTNEPGTDIGVRLWDVAKRRQPPKADEPAKLP